MQIQQKIDEKETEIKKFRLANNRKSKQRP